MQRIVATYYAKALNEKSSVMSGLVFELEDGTLLAHAQATPVAPLEPISKEEIEQLEN